MKRSERWSQNVAKIMKKVANFCEKWQTVEKSCDKFTYNNSLHNLVGNDKKLILKWSMVSK